MNKAILILLALVVIQVSATPVKICGSDTVDTSSITIKGCDKPPCVVKMGETLSFTLKFTPSSPIRNLTAHAEASNWLLTIPVLDDAICNKIFLARNNSLFPCPLCPEVEYIYKDEIIIPTVPTVPFMGSSMKGIVRLTLETNSKTIKCFETEGRLN